MYTKQKKILQNAIKDLQLQTMLKKASVAFLISAASSFSSILFAQNTINPTAPTPSNTTSSVSASIPLNEPVATPAKVLANTPAALQSPLPNDSNSLFQAAIASYKKHNLDEARKLLTLTLNKTPSSEAYYDLGLVEYEAKNLGTAVGLWRKAIELDPQNQLASDSLSFIQKRIEHPELNRQNDSFEVLRERVLNHARIEYLFLLTIFILAAFFWLTLSYLGERKRSREQELASPRLPWIAAILFFALIGSTIVSAAKLYDLNIQRATVLPAKISVLSAPDAESTQLFELFEGLEVVVESSQSDYYQVTFPGGMTGWTLKKNLMLTGGHEI